MLADLIESRNPCIYECDDDFYTLLSESVLQFPEPGSFRNDTVEPR
jgi:hypothetical protein